MGADTRAKLTPDQQIAALQLRAAALFPEEQDAEQEDSAVAVIKQLIALNVKTIPSDMTWPGLTILVRQLDRQNQPGKVWLGSRAANAMLQVNDQPPVSIGKGKTMTVPSGNRVKIVIKADKCEPWDTAFVITADSILRFGYRPTNCTP